MAQASQTQRGDLHPQGADLIHPLDGLPLPTRLGPRCQNRHRCAAPASPVPQASLALARFVGVVLLAAAGLRLLALGMAGPTLDAPHRLLPWLSAWQVVVLAAAAEAIAGLGTFVSRREGPVLVGPSLCLATLSGYRAIATWLNVETSLGCLGPVARWLHGSPATEPAFGLCVLLGCLVLMTIAWWSRLRNGGGLPQGPLPAPHSPTA